MRDQPIMNPATIVALRVVDLRAEFEAQLRAVMRLEEQLRKANGGNADSNRNLANAVRRELAEMLTNNANIRNVLNELAIEAEAPAQAKAPGRPAI
jgi:hypothetical protein